MQQRDRRDNKRLDLVPFLLRHAAIGLTLAIIFVGVLVYLDVGGLTTLLFQSDVGMFALVLLTVMIGLTFSSVQMGFAIMLERKGPDDPPGPYETDIPAQETPDDDFNRSARRSGDKGARSRDR